MPTKTRYTMRKRSLSPLEQEHLRTGPQHLLAAAEKCRYCEEPSAARAGWRAFGQAIMKEWRYPFPCFGAVVFGGASFPEDPSPIWTAHQKLIHKLVRGSLTRV
jgi:hypothetical protein